MDTKSSPSTSPHQRDYKHLTFQCFLTPVFTLVTLTHHTLIGYIRTTALTEIAWLQWQILTISPFFIIQKTQSASIAVAGTLALIHILFSAALALTVAYPKDVF